jgi:hypothetical protein
MRSSRPFGSRRHSNDRSLIDRRLWRLVVDRARVAEPSSFELFPGFVAGYVPWRFFGPRPRVALQSFGPEYYLLGLLCIVPGAALLAACIFEFARSGRGTLSPIDPPRRLV